MDNAWRPLVISVLRELGADEVFVPGSRLTVALVRRATEEGLDLREHLRTQGLNPGRFLKQFEPEIEVRNRGASDMLVGFPGAEEKRVAQPQPFRKDVFDAFSKFGGTVYYDGKNDQFLSNPEETTGLLTGPHIARETILEDRAAFARTQSDPIRSELLAASAPEIALSSFMKIVIRARALKDWQRFRSLRVLERIKAWAQNNDIEPRPNWFKKTPYIRVSPRALLHGLLQQMTDDEIRDLRVSVRAVESLLRRGRFQVEEE